MTLHWKIDENAATPASLKAVREAAALLREGKTVAFPTETVYGLGADAAQTEAVRAIFTAKGRPSDNPLIVHIADCKQLEDLVSGVPEVLVPLMDACWPGPLTLILPVRPDAVSLLVTAGLDTVGIRIPDHPVALALLREAGIPIAAPSANSSGRPSPTKASHVLEDLDGCIEGIIDGGAAGVGIESTVLQWKDGVVHVLRPGGISLEQLQVLLPGVPLREPASSEHVEAPRAPGMKYTHYAPAGKLLLVQGSPASRVHQWMNGQLALAKGRGERTGVLTFEEHRTCFEADYVSVCGSLANPDTIARRLYDGLRSFDEHDITYILAETCPEEGIGQAVMNRLLKAAGHHIVQI